MRNNKKGFTLVELLVVISLMATVLALVIVSVTNISKMQKENAYKQVKEQISVAAQQYFSSNEYFFEGMTNSQEALISVGELVEAGFLNVLTNPKTGKKLNNCDKVIIQKENGKYKFDSFSEDSNDTCSNPYVVSVKEIPAIEEDEESETIEEAEEKEETSSTSTSSKIIFYGQSSGKYEKIESSTWINRSSYENAFSSSSDENIDYDILYVCIKIEGLNVKNVTSTTSDYSFTQYDSNNYYIRMTGDFKKEVISYTINYLDETTENGNITIKKDTTIPDIKITTNLPCIGFRKVSAEIEDETSGIKRIQTGKLIDNEVDGRDKTYSKTKDKVVIWRPIINNGIIRVTDVAGNIAEKTI